VESSQFGFLPPYEPGSFEIFNDAQRRLAAQALSRGGARPLPDLVVLQEVESMIALRTFNERYLDGHYPHALLVDSRDYRQIDVGVLAGPRLRLDRLSTHVDDLAKAGEEFRPGWPWQFSRDCLEVHLRLPGGRRLGVYLTHSKSKFVQPRAGQTPAEVAAEEQAAATYRRRQSEAVLEIVRARHPGSRFDRDWFVVAGDLNSLSAEEPAGVFRAGGLEDAVGRLPADQRWTEYYAGGGSVGQLDYLFLSPALAAATAGTLPEIERRGIGMRAVSKKDGRPLPAKARLEVSDAAPPAAVVDFQFPRFADVGPKAKASDHCPVFLDLP
jgi:endonuclease/exonuclease/phosphatase family metal-dependent hydrolase